MERNLLQSEHLYDHKFDVDDVIRALCGDDHEGRWLLSTRNGDLIAEGLFDKKDVNEGDDNNHWHVITPLPLTYITEISQSFKMMDLAGDDRHALRDLLGSIDKLYHILESLNDERYGQWLYDRLKEEALEWLDERDLIPPSMHHVRQVGMPSSSSGKFKVKITTS